MVTLPQLRGPRRPLDVKSLELFPLDTGLDAWRDEPLETFVKWLWSLRVGRQGDRKMQVTSVVTYAGFFQAWLTWLDTRRATLFEATSADVETFLQGTKRHSDDFRSPLTRLRYLTLLYRMYAHLKQEGWEGVNPFEHLVYKERTPDPDKPLSLDDEELELLRAAVRRQSGWKGARDGALLALMADAGLRANEILALQMNQVSPMYQVDVKPVGIQIPHVSIVLPGPGRVDWDAWRASYLLDHCVITTLAFPASRKGRPLSPAGLFRRIDTWLERADIEAPERGANLLRNTFARRALTTFSELYTPEQVKEFLGYTEDRSLYRHLDAE